MHVFRNAPGLSEVLKFCPQQTPATQPMMSFPEKVKDKSVDLQNFGLRTDMYSKKAGSAKVRETTSSWRMNAL